MRSKLQVRKLTTEKQKSHNDPTVRVKELQANIKYLNELLVKFQQDEVERAQIRREYLAAQAIETHDGAELVPAPQSAYGKAEITWLDTSGHECRRASVTIPEDWDKPIIFVKGDEQLGHVTCDEERVKKDIVWVEKNPQCLVMLLGDAIDSATKFGPGSIRENNKGPIGQATEYVNIHKSISNRIVGYVGGNHERRIDKALDEGGAAVKLIAEGLSTPEHKIPYSSGLLFLDLYWRGHLWTVTLFHGAGAAATSGSKTQRLQRNILLTDSIITLSGHLHEEMKTSRRFTSRAPDGKLKNSKQTALQCGTYLKYIGSYGEVGGMAPTGPDMIVIELLADGRYIDRFKGESDS